MKSYPVFILITVTFFGLVLLWIAMARYDEFIRHNEAFARQATSGVADEIARFIINKQRLVELFSQEQRPLLDQLIKQPDTKFINNNSAINYGNIFQAISPSPSPIFRDVPTSMTLTIRLICSAKWISWTLL
jgi:hypothetical protein